MTRHDWKDYDGSAHCFYCGQTVHHEPWPEDGCVGLETRLKKMAEYPMRWSERSLRDTLRAAAEDIARLELENVRLVSRKEREP